MNIDEFNLLRRHMIAMGANLLVAGTAIAEAHAQSAGKFTKDGLMTDAPEANAVLGTDFKKEKMMKEQSKLVRALIGSWHGTGTGPQGPFDVNADFEERGRWIFLRHQISPPGVEEPFYVSTQVFGFNDTALTLDYFDTAGQFHFNGEEIGKELVFKWTNDEHEKSSGDLWKVSKYEHDGPTVVRFSYQSCELQEGGAAEVLEFSGGLKRK